MSRGPRSGQPWAYIGFQTCDTASSPADRGPRATVLWFVVYLGLVSLLVLGTVAVAADDPPELHSGEKINKTAVELLFTHEEGVDGSSFNSSHITLNEGEIDRLSVDESNSNATVTIILNEPIDRDTLLVQLDSNNNVSSDNGTAMPEEAVSVTIDDMDGVPPRLLQMEATNATIENNTEIRYTFHEEVVSMNVTVGGGGEIVDLTMEDFEKVRDYTYIYEYEPPTNDRYVVNIEDPTDEAGNTRDLHRTTNFWAEVDPIATASIDFGASHGMNFTFDANRSQGAENFTWDMGDGTVLEGERVNHTFQPGDYTVTLEAERGDITDPDEISLDLRGEANNATFGPGDGNVTAPHRDVTLAQTANREGALASIFSATAGETVRIEDEAGKSIIESSGVTLEGLDLTPEATVSFDLSVTGVASSAIQDVEEAINSTSLGGFLVVQDSPVGFEEVTFTFSVTEATLDEAGVDPETVQLVHESGGEWQDRTTTHLSQDGERHIFEAETGGFSRFAITGEAAVEAENGDEREEMLYVSSVEVSDSTVEPGSEVLVTGTIENDGEEVDGFRAGLEVDDELQETFRVDEVPAGQNRTVDFIYVPNESGTKSISINGTHGVDLVVEDDGGLFGFLPGLGILSAIVGFLSGMFGLLPLGLLRTVALWLGVPLLIIYLVLKGMAIYLGY